MTPSIIAPDMPTLIADNNGDPLSRSYHKLSMARALEVVQEVTEALAAAHRVGIIHRDIKPGNILVGTRDGRPHAMVVDFGIPNRPVLVWP